MKIGIVGGTGNISQAIVQLLLEQGHEVVCFNRGQTAPVPEGVRVILGDRYNREDFEQKMQAEKFDAAIDMICFTAEDAASSIRAFRGVGWFVQTSTTCTYGVRYDYLPVDETHALRPNTEYGREAVRITIFRIIQESLNNVVKHAGASYVDINLTFEASAARIRVRDNGTGFDTTLVRLSRAGRASLGLAGMEERAALLGACGGTWWSPTRSTPGWRRLPHTISWPI